MTDRRLKPEYFTEAERNLMTAWPAGVIWESQLEHARRNRPAKANVIFIEGQRVHVLLFHDGSIWDVLNGWRKNKDGSLIIREARRELDWCPMCNWGIEWWNRDGCEKCGWRPGGELPSVGGRAQPQGDEAFGDGAIVGVDPGNIFRPAGKGVDATIAEIMGKTPPSKPAPPLIAYPRCPACGGKMQRNASIAAEWRCTMCSWRS